MSGIDVTDEPSLASEDQEVSGEEGLLIVHRHSAPSRRREASVITGPRRTLAKVSVAHDGTTGTSVTLLVVASSGVPAEGRVPLAPGTAPASGTFDGTVTWSVAPVPGVPPSGGRGRCGSGRYRRHAAWNLPLV